MKKPALLYLKIKNQIPQIYSPSKNHKEVRKLNRLLSLNALFLDIKDMAYNKKLNAIALLSVYQKVTYHLFDCSSWQIAGKTGWYRQHNRK